MVESEVSAMEYAIKEIIASSILSKSGLPDADWVINPYIGCRFGCKYCYAAFVGRFRHPNEPWGSYVDVKMNAPELLRRALTQKLKGKKKRDIGTIFLSSVTDPYQGLETKYKITRQCLQVLVDMKYEGKVGILTKSHGVLRDIDLLKKLSNVEVGLTVTSTGDPISKYLETYASPHELRLATLGKLHDAGIATYAFVGPLLPHFVFQKRHLAVLLKKLKETGVGYIYLEHINLSPPIRARLFAEVSKDYPQLIAQFEKAQSQKYRDILDRFLLAETAKLGLKVAHAKPIYHLDKSSWARLKI